MQEVDRRREARPARPRARAPARSCPRCRSGRSRRRARRARPARASSAAASPRPCRAGRRPRPAARAAARRTRRRTGSRGSARPARAAPACAPCCTARRPACARSSPASCGTRSISASPPTTIVIVVACQVWTYALLTPSGSDRRAAADRRAEGRLTSRSSPTASSSEPAVMRADLVPLTSDLPEGRRRPPREPMDVRVAQRRQAQRRVSCRAEQAHAWMGRSVDLRQARSSSAEIHIQAGPCSARSTCSSPSVEVDVGASPARSAQAGTAPARGAPRIVLTGGSVFGVVKVATARWEKCSGRENAVERASGCTGPSPCGAAGRRSSPASSR